MLQKSFYGQFPQVRPDPLSLLPGRIPGVDRKHRSLPGIFRRLLKADPVRDPFFLIRPVKLQPVVGDQHDIPFTCLAVRRDMIGKLPAVHPFHALDPVQFLHQLLWHRAGLVFAENSKVRCVRPQRRDGVAHKIPERRKGQKQDDTDGKGARHHQEISSILPCVMYPQRRIDLHASCVRRLFQRLCVPDITRHGGEGRYLRGFLCRRSGGD